MFWVSTHSIESEGTRKICREAKQLNIQHHLLSDDYDPVRAKGPFSKCDLFSVGCAAVRELLPWSAAAASDESMSQGEMLIRAASVVRSQFTCVQEAGVR